MPNTLEKRMGYVTSAKAFLLSAAVFALMSGNASAAGKYDTGASDTEIKIGNIMPYSGPASAYSIIGKTLIAYFKMINDNGGINGRKIDFISYDDAYSPPKTVEQTRKLVESDGVLLLFNPLGTAGNSAIQKYMNQKKVPHLFLATGASKWADPEHFPWTMGWNPSYRAEARIYARYILKNFPDKKIGILYQNDDFGKDYIAGLHDILKDKYDTMVVSQAPFEVSVPTVDSQVVSVKAANPDIFLNIATPKFAAQAVKKVGEMGWHPIQIVSNVSASVGAVMKPAGLENAKDVLSAAYIKDPTDPQWDKDPTMMEWRAFMAKYLPEADKDDGGPLAGYGAALGMMQVLKQAGDDLTRENIMKQAASLDFVDGAYLPGVKIKTSPTDFAPIEQFQMMKFTGERWERFGEIIDAHVEQ
jgi:branched-chain amino acid transport system substrate-binding protein